MTLPSLFSDFRSDGHIHEEGTLAFVTHPYIQVRGLTDRIDCTAAAEDSAWRVGGCRC